MQVSLILFLTIDTTLLSNSPMRCRKNFSHSPLALTDPVKNLDKKIKANKAQYDLDREVAKISALSNGELEYLTGEDLGSKSDAIQNAKFDYSPLGRVFNKALDESDKKDGLLERLKNIEDKSEEQLIEIENKKGNQLGIKSVSHMLVEELSQEAKNVLVRLINQ